MMSPAEAGIIFFLDEVMLRKRNLPLRNAPLRRRPFGFPQPLDELIITAKIIWARVFGTKI